MAGGSQPNPAVPPGCAGLRCPGGAQEVPSNRHGAVQQWVGGCGPTRPCPPPSPVPQCRLRAGSQAGSTVPAHVLQCLGESQLRRHVPPPPPPPPSPRPPCTSGLTPPPHLVLLSAPLHAPGPAVGWVLDVGGAPPAPYRCVRAVMLFERSPLCTPSSASVSLRRSPGHRRRGPCHHSGPPQPQNPQTPWQGQMGGDLGSPLRAPGWAEGRCWEPGGGQRCSPTPQAAGR